MKILALDPATSTGYALSDAPPGTKGVAIISGVWRLSVHSSEHPGQRLVRLRDFLYQAAETWGFNKLAFEDSSMFTRNLAAKIASIQLRGVILLVAAEYGVPVYAVNPSTLKKWATGFGAADKSQMIRACKTFFGVLPRSGDEADAIFILAAAHANVGPEKPTATRRRRTTMKSAKEPALFR